MIPISKTCLSEAEAADAYKTVLSGWVTQGPRVLEFEKSFADYVGAKYAIAVSSGTTALHLSMVVSGIGEGDEVICPSLSFIATANCIKYVGAKPVFADVDPDTYNLDVRSVESLITGKTKAILLVHQVGLPADISAFKKLASRYKLMLLEDAACAVGSFYQEKRIGSHSDLVCFSFHPRKIITTGEGGMITTSKDEYYNRLMLLRQHGMSVNAHQRHSSDKIVLENYSEIGFNYRMTDIQAAIGIKQLQKLDWIIEARRRIAFKYQSALKRLENIRLPVEPEGYITNFQSYSIYLKNNFPLSRNELMQKLLKKGIATRKGIMTAHREDAYKSFCRGLKLPVSEDLSDRSLIVPLFPDMEDDEVDCVIEELTKLSRQ